MKQQSLPPPKLKTFDLLNAALLINYHPIIHTQQTQLHATIRLTPKQDLVNTPVQVELRGFSHIQTIVVQQQLRTKSLQVTEEMLNESDQKLEINVLMGESKKFQNVEDEECRSRTLDQMGQQQARQGEYFLEGCNVLYQLNDKNGERLEALFKGIQYEYPVSFSLPQRLPVSVDHIVLKKMHIVIRYTLEVKLVLVDKQFGKKQCQALIVPFHLQESQKQYPYEQLVVRELVRFYHAEGKRKDEVMSTPFAKLLRCLCPKLIYESYLEHHHHFKADFQTYDLYHIELVAIVNQGHHVFLVARAYQQPEAQALTHNRQKGEKKGMIKEVNSLGEVPNDISLVSMKHTERRQTGLGVHRVEVEMVGELVGICEQSIFKKTVALGQSNYDMLEGEIMVNLTDHLAFPQSSSNELFTLRYYFKVRPIFEDEPEGPPMVSFQHFVVQSGKKDLIL